VSERVSVEVGPGGGPVAVKRAEHDDDRARLRREAAVLAKVQGAGVVELVALIDDDDQTSLMTIWLGGGTFASNTLTPKKLASVGAALARSVAALHDKGITHGRLTADHVLFDGLGRVVLAGFAEATHEAGGDATAADVRSLGELVTSKLPSDAPPVLRLRGPSSDADVVSRLRAVAARAREEDPTRRPSARALATLLAEVADEPAAAGPMRLGRPTDTTDVRASSRTRTLAGAMPGRAIAAAAGVALVITVGVGAHAAVAGGSDSASASLPVDTRLAVTTSTTSPTTTELTTRVWPSTSSCADVGTSGERRDVDGDGCPDAVTIDGSQIVVDDVRYDLGEIGDAVSVADWDCDGRDTAALVRPATGEVYVFDGWATAGTPMTGRFVDRVAGATAIAPPDGDCGVLAVVDTAGVPTALSLAAKAGR